MAVSGHLEMWPIPAKPCTPRRCEPCPMTSTRPLTVSADELRFRLHGGLHEPGDAYYEDSCALFNTMSNRRPRHVAECLAVDDVVAALAFARDYDLPVAVRAGGHSVAGLSLCDDGLVLDVRGMADIDVDPGRRIARVGGGAFWADLDRATQAHGLATTGGRVSTTGVAGLTLGGGSGWLERKHGLACDNLLAAELVCWDGRIVRASEDQNPELLWALRGGGGSFGVVTALELALYTLGPEVFAGVALFAAHRAQQVLRTFRNIMHQAPHELSLACAFITAPEEDELLHPVFPLVSSIFSTITPCMWDPMYAGESRPKRAARRLPITLPFSAVVPTLESNGSETLPPVILKRAAGTQPPFLTTWKSISRRAIPFVNCVETLG